MINKNIIAQRKSQYGDNFQAIATKWQEYLSKKVEVPSSFKLDGADVCVLMALMKETRIEAINHKLVEINSLKNGKSIDKKIVDELVTSLKDSEMDQLNYLYIKDNWEWYDEL